MEKYGHHYIVYNGEDTCFPYQYEEYENYELLLDFLSDHFTIFDRGAQITVVYELESKKIVGCSIKQHGFEIQTCTFETFKDFSSESYRKRSLEILEFLLNCSNSKYIIRRKDIKNDEIQVYKKLGYYLPSDIVMLEREGGN